MVDTVEGQIVDSIEERSLALGPGSGIEDAIEELNPHRIFTHHPFDLIH